MVKKYDKTGNRLSQFHENFETLDLSIWDLTTGDGDLVEIDGNANGSTYLKISKSALKQNTETYLSSKNMSLNIPMRTAIAVTASQRQLYQDLSFGIAGKNENFDRDIDSSFVTTTAVSAISQTTTTLTVTTATSHNLVPGDRVTIIGCIDNRLNYSCLVVATLVSTTQFTCTAFSWGTTIPSITVTPSAANTYVKKVNYTGGDKNVIEWMMDGTSVTSGYLVNRRNAGSETKTSYTSLGLNLLTASGGSTSPYTYSFYPAYYADGILTMDWASLSPFTTDNTTESYTTIKRSQNLPDESIDYQILFRAKNHDNMIIPIGKIAIASKPGTAVVTVTTDIPHNLTVNDYITIYGIRDTTNFANLTTTTAVTSVVNSTQFTITIGSAVTATSYGGAVFKMNGQQSHTCLTQVVQSVQCTNNIITLIGSASWSGIAVGETVCLYGLYDTAGVSLAAYEGVWKVGLLNGTTVVLVPTKISPTCADIVTTNAGGVLIKQTDYRIHFVRGYEFAPMQVEWANLNKVGDRNAALPVAMSNTVSVTGTAGVNSSTIPNPTLAGVSGVSANPTVVTTGRQAALMADLMGRPVIQIGNVPELQDMNRITVTTTTETVLIAAVASVRNCITKLVIANRDTVAATVDLRDTSAGTVRETYVIPAGQTFVYTDAVGTAQNAVNTNWTVTLRAATTTNAVEISARSYRLNH